jgi:predicted nucleotide-binding protein
VKNCLPIVSSQPGLPDFQDGSIAANLRNAVALKRRLAAAQNLTEAAGAISALWNLFQEEAAPKLYAGIYQREDASSRWIAMPDGLSVPPAVCEQALAIALERRYSHVAVAEGLGAVWCRYATEDRVSVLVAVTGGESVLNESTTWHFQNVLEGLAARIDSLSLQEFGRQLLRRGGNVPVARNGSSKSKIDRRAVFLVHGRNLGIKEEIDAFLRKLELKPVWWEDARSATGKAMPFTFEIVEAGLGMAQAVLVLMTGDDEVRLKREYQGKKNSSAKLELQARPNVLIEAGMAMASHRERTIVLEVGELRPISDFDGLNSIRYDEDKQKARAALVLRLQTAGCDVPPDAHTRAMAAGA